jgi:CubicO group peptidase (beta-lactamase class C family)
VNLERLISAAAYEPATPVAVGVSTGGAITRAGQGDPRLDCDSVAYACSLAKQVTGACAAVLVRDGALDVEAPIAHWLPELPGWSRKIHVRHLIHHTAGLPSTDAVWEQMTSAGETDWTSDGAIAALSAMREPERPPGEAYAYSNVGYICLARILERLSGEALGTVAEARLFGPLAMPATTLSPSPPAAAFGQELGSPAPLSVGDGGLWTSVGDLLRWNDAMLRDTLGVANTIHATGALNDGTPLDYAWGVRVFRVGDQRVQSHGGSWDGAAAKLVRLPDRGASFAVLAADESVERMLALSSLIQDELLSGGGS